MLLALDISLTTGVAWGGPQSGRPRTMVWSLPEGPENFDRAIVSLRDSVMSLCKFEKITHVTVEAAMQKVDWRHSAYTAFLLISLSAVAREAASRHGAKVSSVAVSTWRESILGTARLSTEDAKRGAKARCDQMGWSYQDHNAAEAACLWWHQMAQSYPKWAPNQPMRAEQFSNRGAA